MTMTVGAVGAALAQSTAGLSLVKGLDMQQQHGSRPPQAISPSWTTGTKARCTMGGQAPARDGLVLRSRGKGRVAVIGQGQVDKARATDRDLSKEGRGMTLRRGIQRSMSGMRCAPWSDWYGGALYVPEAS
jgi:hypothetical protein